MIFKKAEEKDIIEALYLINHAIESSLISKEEWKPPIPDYSALKKEVDQGLLYIFRSKNITIGTLSFTDDKPESFNKVDWNKKDDKPLFITRLIINPNWLNKENGQLIIKQIEEFAKQQNYNSIKLNIKSNNKLMNNFYKEIGFDFRGDLLYPEQQTPYYFYEKDL